MAAPLSPTVVRAVGRWSLVAFVVNGIIGDFNAVGRNFDLALASTN